MTLDCASLRTYACVSHFQCASLRTYACVSHFANHILHWDLSEYYYKSTHSALLYPVYGQAATVCPGWTAYFRTSL